MNPLVNGGAVVTPEGPTVNTAEPEADPRHSSATHWSVVLAAGMEDTTQRLPALETLCRTYWYPLFCFARKSGATPEDAQDLTQSFFAAFLEKNYVTRADPERGRFRTFLLTSFRNFLANEWKRARTARRGGSWEAVSYDAATNADRLMGDSLELKTPDKVYDRVWAMSTLQQVMKRLCNEYSAAGKAELFDVLKLKLWGDQEGIAYSEVAARLQMSEAAVKMGVMRLRRCFREALRQEVRQTVAQPGDVEGEVRYLISALQD